MATTNRAELISAAKLSTAVDKAVALAAKRHDLALDDGNVIVNWELIGRILRRQDVAQQFASEVTAEVTRLTGQKLQPATLQIGKQIWCGFFERARIPVSRQWM